jgi:phosphate transport system protein
MHPHMEREIENLKKKILTVSANVETALQKAIRSLRNRDATLAHQVIEGDHDIDQMEVDVEEEVLKILALYNPVAIDLRFVISVLKINNELERIGDQAANIAARTVFLNTHPKIQIPSEITKMVNGTQAMLKKSLDALINMDSKLARDVLQSDDEIDDLHRTMYGIVQQRIRSDIDRIDCWISILSVSRQLERTADQVTNIAEDVIYMVEGEIVRHQIDIP